MTRTVEEYVALALAITDARRQGCRAARAAWRDLIEDMIDDRVLSRVVERMAAERMRRAQARGGTPHCHLSPREGGE